jgi:hypothetical protein
VRDWIIVRLSIGNRQILTVSVVPSRKAAYHEQGLPFENSGPANGRLVQGLRESEFARPLGCNIWRPCEERPVSAADLEAAATLDGEQKPVPNMRDRAGWMLARAEHARPHGDASGRHGCRAGNQLRARAIRQAPGGD